MFKLMGKEINAILGAQTILIWTYVNASATLLSQIIITLITIIRVACSRLNEGTPGRIASDCRYVSDCRSRGREFDPGPVQYFLGDWT